MLDSQTCLHWNVVALTGHRGSCPPSPREDGREPSDILDQSLLDKPAATALTPTKPRNQVLRHMLTTMNTFNETLTCQTAAVAQSKKLTQRIDTASSLRHRRERTVVNPADLSSTSQPTAHCAVSGARFFAFMLRLCALTTFPEPKRLHENATGAKGPATTTYRDRRTAVPARSTLSAIALPHGFSRGYAGEKLFSFDTLPEVTGGPSR